MSAELLQHLYGITTGFYLSVAVIVILFGLSYVNRHYNWRIAAAFFLVAASFILFGLYNIFYQQTHHAVTYTLYPAWFIKLCMVLSPVPLLILTYIYTKAFSMRSYPAYKLIKKYKWVEYFIYISTTANIITLMFINDIQLGSKLIIVGFILPVICAAFVAFASSGKAVSGLSFGVMFSILSGTALYMVWQTFTGNLAKHPNIMLWVHMFFSSTVLFFGFMAIRFGYMETKMFFKVKDMDGSNILHDITAAINKKQFALHYQPQLNLNDNSVSGVEALIRWQHPEKGYIPPDRFIPLAERTDLIDTITQWVVLHAVRHAKTLEEQGIATKVSVNFSPRNFNMDMVKFVEQILTRYELPAHLLGIEMTESLLLQEDKEDVKKAFAKLKLIGVSISVDDYGTGFSSLSYLRKMSIAELKIDRSFIMDLDYNSDNYAIVYSTLQMTRNLGLTSVAEGVEDTNTLSLLREIGCEKVQGYGIARPMGFEPLQQWLKTQNQKH